ncbi:hypothetical protein MuYL_0803 [Mucilaginibacter xinganensis]|uniref:Uncharacterized protein n=1 Tax=Mucilaginibacter xinganensis TaxID=1234841 RepID=A0A223NS74_9SPHI|nr:hypothetical protein MuYL_0803 [Mucilaginibacter xinganensis]
MFHFVPGVPCAKMEHRNACGTLKSNAFNPKVTQKAPK